MLNSYVYMFHEVSNNPDVDFQKMYNQCFMFEEYFKKIMNYISDQDIHTLIIIHFHSDDSYVESLIKSFMDFRSLFRKKGESGND